MLDFCSSIATINWVVKTTNKTYTIFYSCVILQLGKCYQQIADYMTQPQTRVEPLDTIVVTLDAIVVTMHN